MKSERVITLITLVVTIIGIICYKNCNTTITMTKGIIKNCNLALSAIDDYEQIEPSRRIRDNIIYKILSIVKILTILIALIVLFIMIPRCLIKKSKLKQMKNDSSKIDDEEMKKIIREEKKLKINIAMYIILVVLMLGIFNLARALTTFAKPIIYLYPETEQEISVELGKPEIITCSYPKYEDFWNVKANPNGDLVDLKTGRTLYALYWEGKNTNNLKITEGFCVKGEDLAEFLEEKLEILGLTPREAEEFIVYWLPKLEKNKYNLIRFETMEEIENNMPLEINPKPDSIIRVMMEFKSSNKYVDLKEQKLITPNREGFVVVEWGGTEL